MKNSQENTSKTGLHVMIFGGTIDFEPNTFTELDSKQYDLLVPRKNSIIPSFFFNRVKYAYGSIHFSRIEIVDSRDITNEHLAELERQITQSPHKQILITLGIAKLDMVKDFLKKRIKTKNKVIGLVGSRQPLSNYQSDAGFHLGYAIGKIQNNKPGIYSFHPDKNRSKIMKQLNDVVFIITGGTIESYYDDTKGQEVPYEESRIADYFEKALGIVPNEPDFIFKVVSMKDSRNLSQEDYRVLVNESLKNRYKKQIIIGGTYGLPDICRRFQYMVGKKQLPENIYAFVGSMFPEDTFLNDGWFNIGFSLGKIEKLENEPVVAMHGWVTPPDNIWKQLNEAKFLLHNQEKKR